MQRPPLEVADIVRAVGNKFVENSRQWITRKHLKVLRAIVHCRTAELGYHLDECTNTDCGYSGYSYNSCRDRHCPKCQANARRRWINGRKKELLPVPYAHVVLTVPRLLAQLALQNKKLIYTMLLRLSAETLIEVARNPKFLGADIGFFSVLHTWTQKMEHHPHVHCVVPAGGLSFDHKRWIPAELRYRFFLPKGALRKVFRGKVTEALKQAFAEGKIGFYGKLKHLSDPKTFRAFIHDLHRTHWVVHCEPPFGGPEDVIKYLGRYTHRVAISNYRLVSFENGEVTFAWRDRAHGNVQKTLPLPAEIFLRRFLLHLLPKGFVRIRSFGFLANRRRGKLLPLCFQALGSLPDAEDPPGMTSGLWQCPKCGGPMVVTFRVDVPSRHPRPPPAPTVVLGNASLS
jgi:predicted Zn-ribbon and HTH transcriptional regulator